LYVRPDVDCSTHQPRGGAERGEPRPNRTSGKETPQIQPQRQASQTSCQPGADRTCCAPTPRSWRRSSEGTAKSSPSRPHPDQLIAWRLATFAILVIGTIGLVWEGSRRKSTGPQKVPLLEITAALTTAVGWSFAFPDSPLSPHLHSTGALTITPLLVGFAAIVFTAITASALQSQRGVTAHKAGLPSAPAPLP
jgi:hypothetical protein